MSSARAGRSGNRVTRHQSHSNSQRSNHSLHQLPNAPHSSSNSNCNSSSNANSSSKRKSSSTRGRSRKQNKRTSANLCDVAVELQHTTRSQSPGYWDTDSFPAFDEDTDCTRDSDNDFAVDTERPQHHTQRKRLPPPRGPPSPTTPSTPTPPARYATRYATNTCEIAVKS